METVTLGEGCEESGLCLMLKGLLDDAVSRRGRLFALGSRIGIDASDAGAQATLVLGGDRCTVEEGLRDPDLVLEAPSDLLPQVGELPLRFGLPWLPSEAGRRLLVRALLGELRLRGAPSLRTPRAAVDLLLLLRLLSGAAA